MGKPAVIYRWIYEWMQKLVRFKGGLRSERLHLYDLPQDSQLSVKPFDVLLSDIPLSEQDLV
jgi:hypothetical protein